MNFREISAIIALIVITLFIVKPAISVEPSGSTLTIGESSSAAADPADSVAAQAGNVTELNIFGYSTTQSWQGFYGNVTGVIQLADANDDVLYNWSLASPQGEVYASLNSTISWGKVQCLNFTANGTGISGGETPGGTNLAGINISQLEAQFSIDSDDVDGVDETFTLTDHDEFFTANLEFSENECISTRIYGDSGAGADGEFEEVLLYEPDTSSVIFTSLLENNLAGFNGAPYDFQMLVLEDGHAGDTGSTPYYFYVELE